MKKVLAIVGPTGTGKTKLGVALAKAYQGEVISGDSMQIYRNMDIGTAKVTADETEGIKHHLIDIKDPDETYSVSEFQQTVRTKISEITDRDKLPIIVGGTGLYIKAALYDYVFEESDARPREIAARYQDYDDKQLYARLVKIDPEAAKRIHPHNRRRVLRAIAIYETTGHKKSAIENAQKHQPVYDCFIVGLTLPRPLLHRRIDHRVDQMIKDGLEDEALKLINAGAQPDWQAMKAIGYKEWFDYARGAKTKTEVIEAIKTHTRQYAKRQYTWFRNQMETRWYEVYPDDFDQTIKDVRKDVDKWISSSTSL